VWAVWLLVDVVIHCIKDGEMMYKVEKVLKIDELHAEYPFS
jgi:hypothetical protein